MSRRPLTAALMFVALGAAIIGTPRTTPAAAESDTPPATARLPQTSNHAEANR